MPSRRGRLDATPAPTPAQPEGGSCESNADVQSRPPRARRRAGAGAQSAQAADRAPFDRVVSAAGAAHTGAGSLLVDVVVAAPAGRSAHALTRAALRDQGAKPVDESAYTFTGLFWNVLPVVQSYNPANQRVATVNALQASQSSWTNVQNSRFAFSDGGTTSRCPSLVKGCKGGPRFDGFNDVGWARLGGNTLGVTWSSSSIDEADMAVNTSFGWSLGCAQQPGLVDLQTVLLHETATSLASGTRTSLAPRCTRAARRRTARWRRTTSPGCRPSIRRRGTGLTHARRAGAAAGR